MILNDQSQHIIASLLVVSICLAVMGMAIYSHERTHQYLADQAGCSSSDIHLAPMSAYVMISCPDNRSYEHSQITNDIFDAVSYESTFFMGINLVIILVGMAYIVSIHKGD